jgi:hypothetical protein
VVDPAVICELVGEGFRWADAAVGALAALGVVLTIAGAAVALRATRHKEMP